MTPSIAICVRKAGIATLTRRVTMEESKNAHSIDTAPTVLALPACLSVLQALMHRSRRPSRSTIVSSAQPDNTAMEAKTTLERPLVRKRASSVTTVHREPPSVISSHARQATTMTIQDRRVSTIASTADSIITVLDMEKFLRPFALMARTALTRPPQRDAHLAQLDTSALSHLTTQSRAMKASIQAKDP